jgi:hypothetical protein
MSYFTRVKHSPVATETLPRGSLKEFKSALARVANKVGCQHTEYSRWSHKRKKV